VLTASCLRVLFLGKVFDYTRLPVFRSCAKQKLSYRRFHRRLPVPGSLAASSCCIVLARVAVERFFIVPLHKLPCRVAVERFRRIVPCSLARVAVERFRIVPLHKNLARVAVERFRIVPRVAVERFRIVPLHKNLARVAVERFRIVPYTLARVAVERFRIVPLHKLPFEFFLHRTVRRLPLHGRTAAGAFWHPQ
jgi:hypothetical protein